jgi:hypothetical protein
MTRGLNFSRVLLVTLFAFLVIKSDYILVTLNQTKGLFGWAVAVKKVAVGCELWKKVVVGCKLLKS